jgi:competence protein ComEC
MERAGVVQIDAFVASHYHEDHFGGIDDVVDVGIPVLESYDRGDKACCVSQARRNQSTFKDYMRTVGEDAIPLRRGDLIDLDPLVQVAVVSSGGVVVGETNPTPGHDENDLSVSLLMTFQGFQAFFGGDIEAATEQKIAARDLVRNVDLYKANHHGSHTSSSAAFMNDLRPSLVVISNGNDGNYHHPRAVSLLTYSGLAAPPTVIQTNKCLRPAPCANVPDAFIADPQSSDQDGTVEIAIDGSTGTYTILFANTVIGSFDVKNPVKTGSSRVPSVIIERVLPNPVGNDEDLEAVTIRNRGNTVVSLTGWTLRDRTGGTWALSGSLSPNQIRTFLRNRQTMSLNNAGDEVTLFDSTGAARDVIEYDAAPEGAVVTVH